MPLTHIGFFRTMLFGAADALIFAGVLFLAENLVGYVGWPRVAYFWVSTSVLLILCFAPTSYLVHRFLARRANSYVLLWVIIGMVAVVIWNALFAASAYWSWREHNYTVEYYEITNPRNPQFGLFSLALVVVTNLIFAMVAKALIQRTPRLAGSS
jgi:uncharacterized membrane protein